MVDRTKQGNSWFNLNASRRVPGLVAQIFFPFDSSEIDGQDEKVIEAFIDYFRHRLNENMKFFDLGVCRSAWKCCVQ